MSSNSARFNSPTLRVALWATGIVAVSYLIIACSVFLIVGHNLTSQIDSRLNDSLNRLQLFGRIPIGDSRGITDTGESQYEEPLVAWTIAADGTQRSIPPGIQLPAQYATATSPETTSIDGNNLRIAGEEVNGLHVVVGQSTDSVTEAQDTLLTAELIVAPLLLATVFFGSLAIGRRVAMPLERARQRVVDFTADASHELRTPLAVIEAQASLAREGKHDVAWYENAMQRIDGESKRMRRLVEDMLWLARFDAQMAPPHGEPVDLAVVAQLAVERFESVAETRQLRLSAEIAAESPVVSAPADWLDRLLGVLLDNACRYTPANGTVKVRVLNDRENFIRLSVEDAGPGIPVHERADIFNRFHRASDTPGGAGLGLAIANSVVGAIGGRWDIGDSDLGGAAMAVILPRAPFAARATSSDSVQDFLPPGVVAGGAG